MPDLHLSVVPCVYWSVDVSKMDGDQCCPMCKTTKDRNPSMKLMVNVCGHALCESCVELLFAKGTYL